MFNTLYTEAVECYFLLFTIKSISETSPNYVHIIGASFIQSNLVIAIAYNGNFVNICNTVALTISTKKAPTIGTIKNALGDGK